MASEMKKHRVTSFNENLAITLHLVEVGTDWTEGVAKREFFFCPKRFLRRQTRECLKYIWENDKFVLI